MSQRISGSEANKTVPMENAAIRFSFLLLNLDSAVSPGWQ